MTNSENFSFFELFNSIIKRWWNIVIIVLLFSIVTYIYTDVAIKPLYRAVGTLYITVDSSSDTVDTMASIDYSNIVTARELTKTYMQILSSRSFYESVAAESGLNYTASQLSGMVSFTNKSETLIVQTSVTSPKAEDSAILVETILNCSQGEISRVVSGGAVKIIDHPVVPHSPSYPSVKRNVFFAVLIGLIIGAILNILIDFFDDSIKELDTFSNKYNIPVLAEIPNVITANNLQNSSKIYAYEHKKTSKKQ